MTTLLIRVLLPTIKVTPSTTRIPQVLPISIIEYKPSYINIKDAITFTLLRIKDYYNSKYIVKFFNISNLINLRLYKGYRIPSITSKKLGLEFISLFKVLKRIRCLTY